MSLESLPVWQEVIYARQNSLLPLERWGHRMVRTSPSQALLFGGFGGEDSEGRYLDDLWEFDLEAYQWRRVNAVGEVPEKRSNYSIHYDSQNNQVVLFGGGALNKLRFNTVSLLDLKRMAWRNIAPDPAEDAPWERTYHSAEFSYPYLVVYGGEGVSNIDLEDCWAFNIQTSAWRKLEFSNAEEGPGQRRFHSTALIGSNFYVIGGCRENYELLGDIHRADLTGLFSQGQTTGFTWQKIIKSNRNLERWGHSSDVYAGQIYIFAGRVSSTTDTNDILVFDPASATLKQMKMKDKSGPKPRRRHASLMVGSSLLCFGGYNGKYLNDFYFITLPSEQQVPQKTNTIVVETYEELERKAKEYQKKIQADWSIEIKHPQGIVKMPTNKAALLKNEFFSLVHRYSESSELSIHLPVFCSVDMFGFIHQLLVEGDAIFCRALPAHYYFDLISALEYFNCPHLIPAVEHHLLTVLTPQNCFEVLGKAVESGLTLLKFKAAQIFLKEGLSSEDKPQLKTIACTSDDFFNNQDVANHGIAYQTYDYSLVLKEVEQLLKFEIEQTQLRLQSPNFFARTAHQIKRIFSQAEPATERKQPAEKQATREVKRGCLSRLFTFLQRLCG